MSQAGDLLHRGKVATDDDAIRQIVAPSRGNAMVTLEATGRWSYVYDLLEPLAAGMVLAHSRRVKAIASARVKTDSVDATTLAHLLRTNLLPRCYVPPLHIRGWRELLRTRQALVHMRASCCVRIHALLAKEGLNSPVSDLMGRRGRRWLAGLDLGAVHRYLLQVLLAQVDKQGEGIRLIEGRLRQELGEHPVVKRLQEIPGFGPLTSMAFLAEVGDVRRFPRARHLVSYLGLAPRVRASGEHTRYGRLSKEGPPLARAYLGQAVQGAIGRPGPCQELYNRVSERGGSHAARMAVARKLAILAYHVCKSFEEVSYQAG